MPERPSDSEVALTIPVPKRAPPGANPIPPTPSPYTVDLFTQLLTVIRYSEWNAKYQAALVDHWMSMDRPTQRAVAKTLLTPGQIIPTDASDTLGIVILSTMLRKLRPGQPGYREGVDAYLKLFHRLSNEARAYFLSTSIGTIFQEVHDVTSAG